MQQFVEFARNFLASQYLVAAANLKMPDSHSSRANQASSRSEDRSASAHFQHQQLTVDDVHRLYFIQGGKLAKSLASILGFSSADLTKPLRAWSTPADSPEDVGDPYAELSDDEPEEDPESTDPSAIAKHALRYLQELESKNNSPGQSDPLTQPAAERGDSAAKAETPIVDVSSNTGTANLNAVTTPVAESVSMPPPTTVAALPSPSPNCVLSDYTKLDAYINSPEFGAAADGLSEPSQITKFFSKVITQCVAFRHEVPQAWKRKLAAALEQCAIPSMRTQLEELLSFVEVWGLLLHPFFESNFKGDTHRLRGPSEQSYDQVIASDARAATAHSANEYFSQWARDQPSTTAKGLGRLERCGEAAFSPKIAEQAVFNIEPSSLVLITHGSYVLAQVLAIVKKSGPRSSLLSFLPKGDFPDIAIVLLCFETSKSGHAAAPTLTSTIDMQSAFYILATPNVIFAKADLSFCDPGAPSCQVMVRMGVKLRDAKIGAYGFITAWSTSHDPKKCACQDGVDFDLVYAFLQRKETPTPNPTRAQLMLFLNHYHSNMPWSKGDLKPAIQVAVHSKMQDMRRLEPATSFNIEPGKCRLCTQSSQRATSSATEPRAASNSTVVNNQAMHAIPADGPLRGSERNPDASAPKVKVAKISSSVQPHAAMADRRDTTPGPMTPIVTTLNQSNVRRSTPSHCTNRRQLSSRGGPVKQRTLPFMRMPIPASDTGSTVGRLNDLMRMAARSMNGGFVFADLIFDDVFLQLPRTDEGWQLASVSASTEFDSVWTWDQTWPTESEIMNGRSSLRAFMDAAFQGAVPRVDLERPVDETPMGDAFRAVFTKPDGRIFKLSLTDMMVVGHLRSLRLRYNLYTQLIRDLRNLQNSLIKSNCSIQWLQAMLKDYVEIKAPHRLIYTTRPMTLTYDYAVLVDFLRPSEYLGEDAVTALAWNCSRHISCESVLVLPYISYHGGDSSITTEYLPSLFRQDFRDIHYLVWCQCVSYHFVLCIIHVATGNYWILQGLDGFVSPDLLAMEGGPVHIVKGTVQSIYSAWIEGHKVELEKRGQYLKFKEATTRMTFRSDEVMLYHQIEYPAVHCGAIAVLALARFAIGVKAGKVVNGKSLKPCFTSGCGWPDSLTSEFLQYVRFHQCLELTLLYQHGRERFEASNGLIPSFTAGEVAFQHKRKSSSDSESCSFCNSIPATLSDF